MAIHPHPFPSGASGEPAQLSSRIGSSGGIYHGTESIPSTEIHAAAGNGKGASEASKSALKEEGGENVAQEHEGNKENVTRADNSKFAALPCSHLPNDKTDDGGRADTDGSAGRADNDSRGLRQAARPSVCAESNAPLTAASLANQALALTDFESQLPCVPSRYADLIPLAAECIDWCIDEIREHVSAGLLYDAIGKLCAHGHRILRQREADAEAIQRDAIDAGDVDLDGNYLPYDRSY